MQRSAKQFRRAIDSPKKPTNKFVLFSICHEKQKSKQNKLVGLFFGRIYGRPIFFQFYLTFTFKKSNKFSSVLSQNFWLIRCTWSLGHRLSVYCLVYHFLAVVHKLLLLFFILHFQTMIPPNSIQFPFPLLKAKEKYEIKCKVKDLFPQKYKKMYWNR